MPSLYFGKFTSNEWPCEFTIAAMKNGFEQRHQKWIDQYCTGRVSMQVGHTFDLIEYIDPMTEYFFYLDFEREEDLLLFKLTWYS